MIDYEQIREQQVQRLIDIGCDQVRGTDEKSYRNFLPNIEENKNAIKAGYTTPIIIETLPLEVMTSLMNFGLFFQSESARNIEIPEISSVEPYVTWVRLSKQEYKRPPELWYKWLDRVGRVALANEGLNLLAQQPNFMDSNNIRALNLLGTSIRGSQAYIGRDFNLGKKNESGELVWEHYTYYLGGNMATSSAVYFGQDVLVCYNPNRSIGPHPDILSTFGGFHRRTMPEPISRTSIKSTRRGKKQ